MQHHENKVISYIRSKILIRPVYRSIDSSKKLLLKSGITIQPQTHVSLTVGQLQIIASKLFVKILVVITFTGRRHNSLLQIQFHGQRSTDNGNW